jgi:undecaprenyl diphosphate synthase
VEKILQEYFMMQSNFAFPAKVQSLFHVAIIMDGNGRWATARGMRRVEGHRGGARAVRRTVRAAPPLGITTLTLFAFSCDNWKRPRHEVGSLMGLFAEYLESEKAELLKNGVRLSVIGRRDRLTRELVAAIEDCEVATGAASRLHLRLAIDYSAREAIVRASRLPAPEGESGYEAFRKRLGSACGADTASDVDLLIRTGGERRLSDFLLWESAYAELVFLPRMWPDFRESDLAAAVAEFHTRQRRFGGLPLSSVGGLP